MLSDSGIARDTLIQVILYTGIVTQLDRLDLTVQRLYRI